MALDYTTANSGLFVRFGVIAGACRDIVALKGGTATSNVASGASLGGRGISIEQNAAASPTQYPLVDGIWTLINSARSSMSGTTQSLSSLAQSLFIDQVNQDSPLTSKDLTSALREAIRQMRATSDSINGSTVSLGSQTAFGTVVGNPIIVGTLKSTSGYTLQTPFAESVKFICTGDVASGSTARVEPMSAAGKPAVSDVFSESYPSGSGGTASLTLADAKKNNSGGNKLQNGSFETFTNPDYPDNWVIATGTAGTQVTANGSGYTGVNAVKINGDSGGTLTCLRQTFNTTATTTAGTGGTPGTLSASTRYAVNYYIKSPSVPAAGVLRFRLVDGSNNVINDDAGNANSFSLTLSGISTSYVSHTGVFVTPTTMPTTYKIEVALTTAITDTKSVVIDDLCLTPMTQLYTGGPAFAAFAGDTNPVRGDTWTMAVSASLGVIADYLERMFALRSKGLIVPYKDDASETVADSLVT
jgi:hypothetical protein